MPVIKMRHAADPKAAIIEKLGDLTEIEVLNDKVLIAIYEHDGVTEGGIITGPATKRESKFQGKVGLIMKMGPCVNPEGQDTVRGCYFEIGDWVAVNASDGLSMNAGAHANDVMLRLVSEKSIHIRVKSPDSIW